MNIVYVSSLIPPQMLDEVLAQKGGNYVVAPNKFHHTIVDGLICNGHKVVALSHLPIGVEYQGMVKEGKLVYYFIKYVNKPIAKHIQIARGVYKKIKHLKKTGFTPDVLICDILNVSVCLGALLAGKIFNIKTVGIVTDLLGISSHEEKNPIHRMAAKISNTYIKDFDYYILLTQQMNEVVNPKKRPYIIMEGICDDKAPMTSYTIHNKRRLFYAGGRPSKDGIDMLIPAFKRLDDPNLELHLYGSIPNVNIGQDPEDKRIFYHGIVDNKTIVEEECKSDLLLNPRPTGESYTLYSFPSKVMEYMVTGIPMVTTRLAGIPKDYYKFVYTFDECSEDCYFETLSKILALPSTDIQNKGREAQKYVISNKNKKTQTERIVELIKTK